MCVFLGMAYWLDASVRHYSTRLQCPATAAAASSTVQMEADSNSSLLAGNQDIDLDLGLKSLADAAQR